MKVLLLFLGDIDEAPYFKKYIRKNINYHSISVDKFNNVKNYPQIERKFILKDHNKLLKIWAYKRTIKKTLKQNIYNCIIILNSQLSVILNKELLNFKGDIILDIRDYVLENNKVYSYFQNKIINKSVLTTISSEGYKNFLPDYKYYVSHNTPNSNPSKSELIPDFENLKIGQIGFIRFIEINNKLVEYFENEKNIDFYFIGNGSKNINNSNNVYKIGYFKPADTYKYYEKINIINNIYGSEDINVKYALSNKLYLSALLYKPILVSPDTEMSKIVTKYNLGYVFDIDEPNKKDSIRMMRQYFENLDWNNYKKNCDNFILKVNNENVEFIKKVNTILKDE